MPKDGRLSIGQYTWRMAAGGAASGAALAGAAGSAVTAAVPTVASTMSSVLVAPLVNAVFPSGSTVATRVASATASFAVSESVRTAAVTTATAAQWTGYWALTGAGAAAGTVAGLGVGLVTYPAYSYFYAPVPMRQLFGEIKKNLGEKASVPDFIQFLSQHPNKEKLLATHHLLPSLKVLAEGSQESLNQPIPYELEDTLKQVIGLSLSMKEEFLVSRRSTQNSFF